MAGHPTLQLRLPGLLEKPPAAGPRTRAEAIEDLAADLAAHLQAHGLAEAPARKRAALLAANVAAPVVLHSGGWSIGPFLPEDVLASRLAAAFADAGAARQEDSPLLARATIPEVVAYLCTASLCFPLDHDYAQIYATTAHGYFVGRGLVEEGEAGHWREQLGVRELSAYQEDLLERLRRDIARARCKHAQAMMRSKR